MFSFNTFDDAYNFIVYNGGYDDQFFLYQKQGEDSEVYRSRIFRIASRIKDCLERYPKEILEFYEAHPEKAEYTFDELSNLKYRELARLRSSLGIKKKRQSSKKVTKVEEASSIFEQGLQAVSSMSTSKLAASIIADNEEKEQHEEILTSEEIEFMYGEDMPSVQELRSKGIIPEYPEEYTKRLK